MKKKGLLRRYQNRNNMKKKQLDEVTIVCKGYDSMSEEAKLRVQEILKKSFEEEFNMEVSVDEAEESNSQCTVKDLRRLLKQIDELSLSEKEKDQIQIYLGDDDELNGIHTGWYAEMVDLEKDFMINETIKENNSNCQPLKRWIVLFS